ncbi:N-acetylmuramoyl-L-alanine amidase [Candidatus Doolittlea endobia]|uniref:N-acetylmuramoyl-L-alanine amidase n=1 Tax=Candidatus Doolittlea endobia TaxID=1778262 RepID=A0A143WSV6_9ENTR|nr:N-acetylmuramoyl-L-alanine amidase [Candidatus Doolittlea endobia]CUX96617.1 N-acetylmuramoyl-L-alanine amidase AmiD precursor [Candidatus Doolittlea endobia]
MKRIFLLFNVLSLVGCVEHHITEKPANNLIDHGDYAIDTFFPSQVQDERVRFLIFHYTAVDDTESLRLLTQGKVSAHYLISSNPGKFNGKPVVLQLVPESKRAWHAGVSGWAVRNNINDTSIGIEIVNDGFHEHSSRRQWIPYHKEQMILAASLARDIIARYQIKPQNVLAHSDIAPLRKTDPGPQFPWKTMAQQGVGAWPDAETVTKYLQGKHRWSSGDVMIIQQALAAYGYTIPKTGKMNSETQRVISAFQMHFRPRNITGVADMETEAIARALVEKYCAQMPLLICCENLRYHYIA